MLFEITSLEVFRLTCLLLIYVITRNGMLLYVELKRSNPKHTLL